LFWQFVFNLYKRFVFKAYIEIMNSIFILGVGFATPAGSLPAVGLRPSLVRIASDSPFVVMKK
jgi:hypothetical protein